MKIEGNEVIRPRFSKTALSEKLRARIAAIEESYPINWGHGTAQLLPRNATDYEKELINRAVAYGRLRAMDDVKRILEDW